MKGSQATASPSSPQPQQPPREGVFQMFEGLSEAKLEAATRGASAASAPSPTSAGAASPSLLTRTDPVKRSYEGEPVPRSGEASPASEPKEEGP
eukprot:1050626-Lingulodinium_polyedra.AAC.1